MGTHIAPPNQRENDKEGAKPYVLIVAGRVEFKRDRSDPHQRGDHSNHANQQESDRRADQFAASAFDWRTNSAEVLVVIVANVVEWALR